LDIGCGKGNISLPLASLGYQIHGIDLDPNEISYVAERNEFPNASFEVGDAENIDFENHCDIVICSAIIEHLLFPENLLRKLRAIVKKDGVILITIPNGYGPYELFYQTPMRLLPRLSSLFGRPNTSADPHVHKHNFSFKTFSTLMGDHSLYIEKVEHSDFMSFWPVVRRVDLLVRIDCKIADILPHSLVSGWHFVCRLK
jgi:SAM-dependent methyltransferase